MGLDKDTASARISRYESESMAISLESIFQLAQALDVPPAYLLATTTAMADAVLLLSNEAEPQQRSLTTAIEAINGMPLRQRTDLLRAIIETGTGSES